MFYVFLEEGYKLQAKRMLRDIHVLSIPKSKENDATRAIKDIRSMLDDPLEKLEPKTDYSGIEKLADNMG